MALKFSDLKPVEAQFELSEFPGKKFTLEKFSLDVQIWAQERFGDELGKILEGRRLKELTELIYYVLKEKDVITSLQMLRKSIVTHYDKIAVIAAIIATVGVAQPVIDKMKSELAEKNVPSPDQQDEIPIGAQSTTS